MQSDSGSSHEAYGSATDQSGAYLLERGEMLLEFGLHEEHRFIDKLLSIFQRSELDFSTFPELLKHCKHFFQIICRRSNVDLIMQAFCES